MKPERLRRVIAANVRKHAAKRKVTIPVLADLAGIAPGSFYRVLHCKASVTADTLARVAEALEVQPRQLLDERVLE